MAEQPAVAMDESVKAHAAADAADAAQLQAMSVEQRAQLIESACEAAAVLYRSRLAAGLSDVEPIPWPASTWEFLRRHAARVRR